MTPQKRPLHILLVDDTPANLLAMEATLEWLGEKLVRAYSGREALDLVAQQEYAVILLDVQMPVMDGFEAASRIREIELQLDRHRPTPIIFVTAAELSDSYMRRAYAEGAVDFIRKPYVAEILRSKVKVFVDLYRNALDLRASEEEVRRLNADLEQRVADRTAALNRALEHVEASELRYRTLAEAMPQIVWTTDEKGEIDYVNSRWEQVLGESSKLDAQFNWLVRVHPAEAAAVEQVWQKAVSNGSSFDAQCRLFSQPQNGYFWVLIRAEPLHTGEGRVHRWLGTFTDIDAQKQAEVVLQEANEALAEARDRALEASEAKSLFLANMSHELRTPLNAIMGYAEIVAEELPPDFPSTVQQDVDRILFASQHLLALINDVLDLAKIEAGKMDLSLNEFPLGPLVHQVISVVSPIAKGRNNSIQAECTPKELVLYSDETKVRQVLLNLLGNACKFTENGAVQLIVRVEDNDSSDEPWVVLQVRDTGIGIEPDQLPKLFREFTQVDSSHTRSYGGTGLGLALSRRFVEMLGGAIYVDTHSGKGSTFTVRIPARVQAELVHDTSN